MGFIRAVRPQQATFVPDSEGQFTSPTMAGTWPPTPRGCAR
jgi:hypothetical protein